MKKKWTRSLATVLVIVLTLSGAISVQGFAAEDSDAVAPPPATQAPAGANGWSTDKLYYYENGTAVTGWKEIDGDWYFFEDEKSETLGQRQTDWLWTDESWYYLDPDTGVMAHGLQDIKGKTFYFSEKHDGSFGVMRSGAVEVSPGNYLVFDKDDGLRKNSWAYAHGGWYCADAKGHPMTGLKFIEGYGYYFEPKHGDTYGQAAVGWRKLNGDWYHFNTRHDGHYGYLQWGWLTVGADKYFLDMKTGKMQYGLQTIDDKTYYFSEKHDGTFGVMQTGWVQLDGGYYFFDKDNGKVEGVTAMWDGDTVYQLEKDGRLKAWWTTVGDEVKQFNAATDELTDDMLALDSLKDCTGWALGKEYGSVEYFVDGLPATGIVTIDGVKYIFQDEENAGCRYSEANYTDSETGEVYHADANGKLVEK